MRLPANVIARSRARSARALEPVAPSSGRRLAGIEGMRAIAASSIVVFHVWLYGSPGGRTAELGFFTRFMPDLAFGVTLFFTLSGFLLYRPFVAALLRGKARPRFGRYLRNRALRIVPAYWAILLVTSLVLQAALVRDAAGVVREQEFDDPVTAALNALLLQGYHPDSVVTGIGPAWSLAVEVVFYLSLPLLVLLAYVIARRAAAGVGRLAAVLVPPVLLLVVGLSGKAAAAYVVPATTESGAWGGNWHAVLVRSFGAQADLFAFGMALAVAHVVAEDRGWRARGGLRAALAGGAVLAYLITAANTSRDQLGYSLFNSLMALATALALALVVFPGRRGTRAPLLRLLESRALVAVGLVSYSLFLWHEPLIRFLASHGLTFGGDAGFFANVAVAGATCLALSWLTYRLVERPALARKARTRAAPPPTAAAAAPAAD
jgi:peptidoglycan/LPS O-acetylase OafA/YrhL